MPARQSAPSPAGPIRISCVCLGNICRSPMAAAILRERAASSAMPVAITSAGTATWHTGKPAHPASVAELTARGIPIVHAARTCQADDFAARDLVLAMDHSTAAHLDALAPTPDLRRKIQLIRDFDPAGPAGREVPDPYSGGPADYRRVFDMLDAACRGLIDRITTQGPPPWQPAQAMRP